MQKVFKITSILFIGFFLFAQQDIRVEIEDKSKALDRIRQEIADFRISLASNKNREKTLLEELNKTEQEISLIEKLLNQLDYEIAEKRKQIKRHEITIHDNLEKIKKLKDQIAIQYSYLYKKGEYSDLELLLTAKNLNQAFYRYKYLRIINDIHNANKESIKTKIRETELLKARIESDIKEREQLIAEKKGSADDLKKQKILRSEQLNKAKRNQKYYAEKIDEKEKAAELLKNIIANLEKEKQKREIEIARQRTLQGVKDNIPFSQKKGNLEWPVNGSVVSRFGKHKHPTLNTITENSGVDIEAKRGTPVITIADGYVTTITYIRGYGNTIIIDHGDDYYTVYTHITNVNVREDQYVAKHTKIAEIGDSGSFDGARLHFEIWNKNNKLNPEYWLKRKV
ncbi:MAG: peptidoglycan DD-metalloendopeptidase family protein [Candidatus Marinimicrobia bacterium]|nr:peptidoglycan DD-metalloendopeptidase family protein [Candidatus Neomarinimicrobiota bacterium]